MTPRGDSSTCVWVSDDSEAETKVSSTDDFQVVAIGASAGGLEAVTTLLRRLRGDRMAVLVMQHGYEAPTNLTSILAEMSPMPVRTMVDGAVLQPGVVLVAPPVSDVALLNGAVQLLVPSAVMADRMRATRRRVQERLCSVASRTVCT